MEAIDCAGVPRELGEAMGRAARAQLRAACGGGGPLDWLGRMDEPDARWWRDLRRHFPHQAEWLEGAARGAGVALPALARAARAALAAPPHVLAAFESAGGPRLACAAPREASLRRVAPEGRFRSLELALPTLTTPWLGVNEAGLAVAGSPGARADGACAAPAALFARDCLERFESVGSALAWCLGRPAAPGAALLLADASGEFAGVELTPQGRRVRRAERGVLVLGGEADVAAALEKRLAATGPEASALAGALGSTSEDVGCADPRGRRLSRGGVWGSL